MMTPMYECLSAQGLGFPHKVCCTRNRQVRVQRRYYTDTTQVKRHNQEAQRRFAFYRLHQVNGQQEAGMMMLFQIGLAVAVAIISVAFHQFSSKIPSSISMRKVIWKLSDKSRAGHRFVQILPCLPHIINTAFQVSKK